MARPSATERMGRILSMVPWIASQGRPRIDEVCDRFDITRDELVADLDVVLLVGLYPYTPDSLIEVDLDEDHVSITYGNFFERPLRLSRDEGLAILAAGLASRTQPGHDPTGPLERGLAKVADVLGIDLGGDLDVRIDDRTAEAHRILDRAVGERTVVHLSYFSHSRNERSERDVEPLRLFSTDGAWYLDAHCRATDEHRVFRLDRIVDLAPTGETFRRDDDHAGPDGTVFAVSPDLPRVTIEVPASDRWVVEQHPTEDVRELDDGRLLVRLVVSARPWLERLLLRLGPSAHVVDGPPELLSARADAASRVLERYESGR